MKYVHLERNRWLKVERVKLTDKYYKGELDKNEKPFQEKIFLFNEIIIADKSPI